ncbi:MAG TPA: sigma factor-like helix-turn-helix DNA-binding protein [Solirubrobacteraceae bacterium]|jgi:plasmid stability protein
MSRLDDLPPDQRATLSLLLRSGKSYAQVAALLDIQERAVHDRAHAALAVLAARQARELTAEQREEVADYLLGQRPGVAERLATRGYLESSAPARAWAGALADALSPLAGDALPEIPGGA